MGQSRMYLFTSPTCPHCHSARILIGNYRKKRDDFVFKEISTATHEGQKLSRKFGIMSVPTFIIKGQGDPIGLRGLQSEKALDKYLDLSYGIEKEEGKKRGFKIGKFRFKF